jgi:hypothetical protein
MRDEVGLHPGQIVFLETAILLAGILSSYIWGWSADRFGSKPIMQFGIILMLLLPLFWLALPRGAVFSLAFAIGIAFWQGLAQVGWQIGSDRFLYVNVIPKAMKTEYTALHYAWFGTIGGISNLAGGKFLDLLENNSRGLLEYVDSAYSPFFIFGLLLSVFSLVIFRYVQADGEVGVGDFAGMFFQGNPFHAAESLIRYQLARDEKAVIRTTELLGQTNSPFTIEELLQTLRDPRFNVRYEAIISVARRSPHPQLTKALTTILQSEDPAMSTMAAWALGRQGNHQAITLLRLGLTSPYHSVRAQCARSLASLQDRESVTWLETALRNETEFPLQVAYATSLGKLGDVKVTDQLLHLLCRSLDKNVRQELALALAAIVGPEYEFIELLRRSRREPGTAAYQSLNSLKKTLLAEVDRNSELNSALQVCQEALANEDLEAGRKLFLQVLAQLPEGLYGGKSAEILHECLSQLRDQEVFRQEYFWLAVHTLVHNKQSQ